MTLQQIRYILEICRCGSIGKAAQQLYIAQPYLSNTLRSLEKELGITIFDRSHRGVELTDDGREFISYARLLYDQEQRILELYSQHKEKTAIHFALSSQHFPFVAKALVECFPSTIEEPFNVHIWETDMHDVIENVRGQKCDIGIINLVKMNRQFLLKYLAGKQLKFQEIATLTPCAYFTASHPLAVKEKVTLEELAAFPYVAFEEEAGLPSDFSEEFISPNAPRSKRRYHINGRSLFNDMISHTTAYSLGSGILPETYCSSNIISRPLAGHDMEFQIGWISRKSYEPTETDLRFIHILKKNITSYLPH